MEENLYLRQTLAMLDLSEITSALESGSYQGAGSQELLDAVGKVYTIELSPELAKFVRERFEGKNVEVFEGRGQDGVRHFVEKIEGNYLAFLDSHYSQGITVFDSEFGPNSAPTLLELEELKKNPPAILIIDDWNDNATIEGYPSQESVMKKIKEVGDYFCWVRNEKNHQLICVRR